MMHESPPALPPPHHHRYFRIQATPRCKLCTVLLSPAQRRSITAAPGLKEWQQGCRGSLKRRPTSWAIRRMCSLCMCHGTGRVRGVFVLRLVVQRALCDPSTWLLLATFHRSQEHARVQKRKLFHPDSGSRVQRSFSGMLAPIVQPCCRMCELKITRPSFMRRSIYWQPDCAGVNSTAITIAEPLRKLEASSPSRTFWTDESPEKF